MNLATINVGPTTLKISNDNWTGRESIHANGELVSKKFSFFGGKHQFQVMENGVPIDYVLTIRLGWNFMINIQILRNGKLVMDTADTGWQVTIPIAEGQV